MATLQIPGRPFASEQIAGLALPGGIFEIAFGQLTINAYVQNAGHATVTSATVDGRPVPASVVGGHFGVEFHAPPDGGLPVTLVLATTGPVRIRVVDGSDGLDGLPGFTPRPAGVGIEGSHDTELAMVGKTYTI